MYAVPQNAYDDGEPAGHVNGREDCNTHGEPSQGSTGLPVGDAGGSPVGDAGPESTACLSRRAPSLGDVTSRSHAADSSATATVITAATRTPA
jgi:hypothetical protein